MGFIQLKIQTKYQPVQTKCVKVLVLLRQIMTKGVKILFNGRNSCAIVKQF
jgi:hypothetical protein